MELGHNTSSSVENVVNTRRIRDIQRRFTGRLLALIEEEPFEYGIDGRADALLREQMAINALATRTWLNALFVRSFPNAPTVMGILRLVARLDYDEAFPEGPTMAVAALTHESDLVRECGVRAFESWGNPRAVPVLQTVRVDAKWLRDYVSQVIADLRGEPGALTHQEDR